MNQALGSKWSEERIRSSSLSAEAEPFIPEHHLGISLVSNKSASMGGNPVWIMFGSKHSKEALPDRPTMYSIWTERDSQIVMFLYEDLHWIRPAQKQSMVLTPIPCGKLVLHTLTQTRRLAKRALQWRSKSKKLSLTSQTMLYKRMQCQNQNKSIVKPARILIDGLL